MRKKAKDEREKGAGGKCLMRVYMESINFPIVAFAIITNFHSLCIRQRQIIMFSHII